MLNLRMFKVIWDILKSKKLAVMMIFILAVLATAGMIVPQDSGTGSDYMIWAQKYPSLAPVIEILQLNRVFQAKWFILTAIVFLINLTACTLQQMINNYRLWNRRNQPITTETTDIEQMRDIADIMTGNRYKPVPGVFSLWVKGRFGIWGSVIFHLALLTITVGSLVSWTMKMEGYIKLAEGEVRYELHDYYDTIKEGPFFTENSHKEFAITLQKQNILVGRTGDVEDIISDIAVMENGEITVQTPLSEKEPLIYRGLRIFQRDAGFAPLFEVTGPGNKVPARTYVLLETHRHSGRAEFSLSGFPVLKSPFSVNIQFYPDMVIKGKTITTDKYTLDNPAAQVYVMEGNRVVAEKVLKPGDYVEFAPYKVKMGDIRHWNGFDIVNDKGADIVFLGSWIALIGLVIIYLVPFKKVQIVYEGGQIEVLGVTNRYRKIFAEELAGIKKELIPQNPLWPEGRVGNDTH